MWSKAKSRRWLQSGLWLFVWIWLLIYLVLTTIYLTADKQSVVFFLSSLFIAPASLIQVLLTLLLFILRQHKTGIIGIPLSIAAIYFLRLSVAFNTSEHKCHQSFDIISYNISSFYPGRYSSFKGDEANQAAIYQWFHKIEMPDILCIQEFFHGYNSDMELSLDSIQHFGDYSYYYMNPGSRKKYEGFFGVITFSRFKAVASGEISFGDSPINKGIYSDLIIHNDTIRVLNLHLSSLSLKFENVNDVKGWWKTISSNINKLKESRSIHINEINKVMDFVDKSPYRVILCGDFNSLPFSYPYYLVSRTLNNTFEHKGRGLGISFHRFPFYARIDNIFVDPEIHICSFDVMNENRLSDHYPIRAVFKK
jgi:endonuclease/exonuclease/phosphatase family metal-dependent hydrolase